MPGYIASIAVSSRIVLKASTVSTSFMMVQAGLKIHRAMDVQAVPPAAQFHRDRHPFRRPATDARTNRVGWMHRIHEDHRFIGG